VAVYESRVIVMDVVLCTTRCVVDVFIRLYTQVTISTENDGRQHERMVSANTCFVQENRSEF